MQPAKSYIIPNYVPLYEMIKPVLKNSRNPKKKLTRLKLKRQKLITRHHSTGLNLFNNKPVTRKDNPIQRKIIPF